MEDSSYNYFKKIRGSDPRLATCRSKLQNQRAKLNQEINMQLRLRNGAEKLFKATIDKKQKEKIALEMSFLNSNLQLLKEQLATMNSSVNIYQTKSTSKLVPMVPLGLKETKEIDFRDTFKDFIQEHYSEDSDKYENAIKEFMEIRQAMRTPTRDENGIKLLFTYYNLLYYIDRRFFPPHRNMGIFFEWFDSLTGIPSTQKTIAFEKASVLFNIAALYTQLAAGQDRSQGKGIDAAIDNFLRGAGMFRYIRDNFSNAPSKDLSIDTLNFFIQLMMAQARECLFEKLVPSDNSDLLIYLEVAQEAAEVSLVYSEVHKVMTKTSVKNYVPISWISLVLVKSMHFTALANHYVAFGLLQHNGEISREIQKYLEYFYENESDLSACIDIRVPKTSDEREQLGKSHLREALHMHEEALRLHRISKQLRKIDNLQERLLKACNASHDLYDKYEKEDDFQDILDAPRIIPATKYQLTLMPPDFNEYAVKDLFHDLGPLKIFSARRQWTQARLIQLKKTQDENFGFSVRGDSPVIIASVDARSLAQEAGMKDGDFIVAINDVDTKWLGHEEVVHLIKQSGNNLNLKVITPIDHDYLNSKASATLSRSSVSTTSTLNSSDLSHVKLRSTNPFSFAKNKQRRATWNFFRRSKSKERNSDIFSQDDNIVLR